MLSQQLEEISARIEAQDRELARLAELAREIPPGITLAENVLHEIDDATEGRVEPAATLPSIFAFRA